MTATTIAQHSKVQLFLGPELAHYGFGEGHPFGPDRMDAFWQETLRQGLNEKVSIAEPVMAKREVIQRFHTAEYVARVIERSEAGNGYLDYGDTPAFKGVYEAAATVVGSVLAAAEESINGHHRRCFIPISVLSIFMRMVPISTRVLVLPMKLAKLVLKEPS